MTTETWLIVDDDERLRARLTLALTERGLRALSADGYESALRVAQNQAPDKAVIDLRMDGHSGLELLRDLLALAPSCQALILTGYGSIATAVDAVKLGAVTYLQKPADVDDILSAFRRAEDGPLSNATETFTPPSLDRAEWEHIQRVLADCGGNISQAARSLGMHRRTLQRKLAKFPSRS